MKIINKLASKCYLRFQRVDLIKFLFKISVNLIHEILWKLRRFLSGSRSPVVHLYTVCWNEEKIIPFFLRHYDDFVDHYFIYDNDSDDATRELFANRKDVSIIKFNTEDTFDDIVHQQIKNNAWKHSRGKADWVIVIDFDEFLYHPNIKEFLQLSKSTILKPTGFNMASKVFPSLNGRITEQIKKGVADDSFSKMVLFNPNRITDVNYRPGAHEAYPEGIVYIQEEKELKLLHYKNLGAEYVLNRVISYRNRLSDVNQEMLYGAQYNEENQRIVNNANEIIDSAIEVI